MNAWTIGWFISLAQIKYILCVTNFYLEKGPLTATEGSCTKIRCSVKACSLAKTAYWFWMKDAQWNETYYIATIIYSTNNASRPVSPDFAKRVTYIGSPTAEWNFASISSQKDCSILICNLNKSDSGNYSFRFLGPDKWVTNNINLKVTENPCLITFEQPPVVNESATIKLTCSTPHACLSRPRIEGLAQLYEASAPEPQHEDGQQKSTTVSFKANWKDDGKQIFCQTEANTDMYLIRNISLTIEYAPKEIQTVKRPENIKEGDTVTLTCSAKGRPDPTFTWYKGEQKVAQEKWTIEQIQESDSGNYYCEAENKHDKVTSDPVNINVLYAPQVEIKMTPPASDFEEGAEVTLTCNVKRSNPQPHTFSWFKNSRRIGNGEERRLRTIQPEDAGSYTCQAMNSVTTGASQPVQITVRYGPRNTRISTTGDKVSVGKTLTLTCNTDAYPDPGRYSWHRYNKNKKLDSSQWTSPSHYKVLTLSSVRRTDEACYMCNATNIIRTGENSRPMCIQVLYSPTNLTLSMNEEVTEGQLITISCTVDSLPESWLTLTRTSKTYPRSSESSFPKHNIHKDFNHLQHTFNATYTDAGLYTCKALNSEGLVTSQRNLVVKYPPKDVTVEADPALILNENLTLTLKCKYKSNPPETNVKWMKITDGKSEVIHHFQTFKIKSVRPSDRGQYICEAKNAIGTGQSQQAEVKVKYGPKHTKITSAAEVQDPDGRRWIMLSCSSDCYPEVKEYSWYRKADAGDKMDHKVSRDQDHKVYSDSPGEYYCITRNDLNQRSSDTVPLFVNDGLIQILRYCLIFLILLIMIILIFVYRQKRKKSSQRGTTSTPACSCFLSWWNCARPRNLRNDPVMAEPFRSRDDLLPDQPCRPNGQRRQPPPDSTPASDVNTVYSTVNLPAAKQGPSAQRPNRQNGGRTEQESLNYASLHFENKQKGKQAEAEVYAVVSKQKPPKKNEQEKLPDYENVTAAKPPDPLSSDTDTSEDELELNYSQVSFKAKKGHQRAGGDSSSDSSSDSSTSDEETQYSQVKI